MSKADSPPTGKKKKKKNDKTMAQIVGFIVCVLLPAFVTIIAPITRVTLSYDGNSISVSARWFVYCLIPYRITRLTQVTSITSDFTAGRIERSSRSPNRRIRTENTAALIFSSAEEDMMIPISPVNMESARKKIEAFLAAPNPEGLRFWAVANWKFSLLMGGALSLLAGLYFVGIGMAIVKFGKKIVQKRK
jgi:hypothetical protein